MPPDLVRGNEREDKISEFSPHGRTGSEGRPPGLVGGRRNQCRKMMENLQKVTVAGGNGVVERSSGFSQEEFRSGGHS